MRNPLPSVDPILADGRCSEAYKQERNQLVRRANTLTPEVDSERELARFGQRPLRPELLSEAQSLKQDLLAFYERYGHIQCRSVASAKGEHAEPTEIIQNDMIPGLLENYDRYILLATMKERQQPLHLPANSDQ